MIGTMLPGPGAIYLSQTLTFVKPVRAGDTITARVEIAEVIRDRNRARLQTVCVNQRGEARSVLRSCRLRPVAAPERDGHRYINRPPLMESSAPVM